MFGLDNHRRNALAMSLGWWYARRLIQRRGAAAVAGYLAGEGLSFAGPRRRRHPFRWLFLLGILVGAGLYWWRRRGGGDDWGDWEPAPPVTPPPAEPVPPPVPDLVTS